MSKSSFKVKGSFCGVRGCVSQRENKDSATCAFHKGDWVGQSITDIPPEKICQRMDCRIPAIECFQGVDYCKSHFDEIFYITYGDTIENLITKKSIPTVEVDSKTNPSHYRQGSIEPWDFIVSQNLNFLAGNVVKYISRYKHKNGVEDLKKAKTYLEKLIMIEGQSK
jgi:hypothetical protein